MLKSKKNKLLKTNERDKYSDSHQDDAADGIIRDQRFAKAQTHPQFQKRHTRHVPDKDGNLLISSNSGVVDERFNAVLTDSRFAMGGDVGVTEGAVDKYGKKQKKHKGEKTMSSSSCEPLEKGEEYSKEDTGMRKYDGVIEDVKHDQSRREVYDDLDDALNNDPESRIAYLTALSRGEIDVSSSEDEDDAEETYDHDGEDDRSSVSDSTQSEDSIYGTPGVLDPSNKESALHVDAEIIFEASRFLAVCNVDWSSVRAVDLYAIISSFAPPGSVKYVKVFPSDFGKERMERDATLGPRGIWKKEKSASKKQEEEKDFYMESEDYSDGDVGSVGSERNHNRREKDDDESSSKNESDEDEDEDDTKSSDKDTLKDMYKHFDSSVKDDPENDDFDAEKLRAYEASKLKYYFAVVAFSSSDAADSVYKELDGMEIGHSSASLDLRAIPESEFSNVVKGREMRDEATSLPSNYAPPDFVVAALQQTAVKCTWEEGDKERERLLTQYGIGNNAWQALTEGDDLKAYLASDISSNEESDTGEDDIGINNKAKNMRALLGLDDSDDSVRKEDNDNDDDSFFNSEHLESDDEEQEIHAKEATLIPGKSVLEDKIRSKLKAKTDKDEEVTPWEKYLQKRKEKRKEKKRLKMQQGSLLNGKQNHDDSSSVGSTTNFDRSSSHSKPSTREELDLLLTGDVDEEAAKDFHMRDLVRIEKNKEKKLKGSRKRKEEEIRNNAVGLDFKLDISDSRFAAVLDGTDDRFGIDKTDPQYKETPAMRELLTEQARRRKSKKRAKTSSGSQDISAEAVIAGEGKSSSSANALSSLVKSLVSKVAKNSN